MCDLDDEDMKPVVKLSKCVGHAFHLSCVEKAFQFSQKCPSCNYCYLLRGPQPSGTMDIRIDKYTKCAGYSCKTISISYSFPSGKQSYMHPSPGESYSGTHRYAYLPDNEEGNRVCRLLMRGFEHGLLFTVGQSVTTGVKNTTIWNGIHHKTSTSGGVSNWGFPDAGYFERVTNELASKGLFCEEFMAKEETARSKLKLKRQLSAEAKEMLSQSLTEESVKRMKLGALHSHLTARGLKRTGSKPVLVSRLCEAITASTPSSSSSSSLTTSTVKKSKEAAASTQKKTDKSKAASQSSKERTEKIIKINEKLAAAMKSGDREKIKALMRERTALTRT